MAAIICRLSVYFLARRGLPPTNRRAGLFQGELLERCSNSKCCTRRFSSRNSCNILCGSINAVSADDIVIIESTHEGAIYAAILTDLRTEGLLNCSFEADDEHPLYVSWDIGMSDNTSLWLMQPGADGRYYLLDCHSTNNQPLSHYISIIRS